MLLKDLIVKLQDIYNRETGDPTYYSMMGEPAIYIDLFDEIKNQDLYKNMFLYKGLSGEIPIVHDVNGSLIISSFPNKD